MRCDIVPDNRSAISWADRYVCVSSVSHSFNVKGWRYFKPTWSVRMHELNLSRWNLERKETKRNGLIVMTVVLPREPTIYKVRKSVG